MATCRYCFGEVEFRYVGGVCTPIHIGGSWCSSSGGQGSHIGSRPFRTIESYTNPNASCPICGAAVFFYQSPNGGRVFFDNLGWPWPKHPCTDNPASQRGKVTSPEHRRGGAITLKDSADISLDLYDLDHLARTALGWTLKLKRLRDNGSFRVSLSETENTSLGLVIDDWKVAPVFVVAPTLRGHPTRRLYFICARLRQIITTDLHKVL